MLICSLFITRPRGGGQNTIDSLQGERSCRTCLTRLLCWVDLELIFFRCVFERVNVEHFAEEVGERAGWAAPGVRQGAFHA